MKYQRVETQQKSCVFCESVFFTGISWKKYCSRKCESDYQLKKTGRIAPRENPMSNCTVGATSELVIATDLLKRGYAVFRQLSMFNMFDLVAIKGDTALFIEARTGYRGENGKMSFVKKIHPKANTFAICDRSSWAVVYFDREINEITLP